MAPARVAVSVALAGALVVFALALASWSVAVDHRVEQPPLPAQRRRRHDPIMGLDFI